MSEIKLENLIQMNPQLQPLADTVNSIIELPDTAFEGTAKDELKEMILSSLTPSKRRQAIDDMLHGFDAEGYNRQEASDALSAARVVLTEAINNVETTVSKKEVIEELFNLMYGMFDEAMERYHKYNFELPMTLDDGATAPTYAHDTDAAADLYAADTIVLPAHSTGNMVRTGVHIQLPENWMGIIVPRSSIGAKTGLRLSNSVGIIDQEYLGQLGVLYDNISDSDYTINAGDRIAQLLIMPSYRFKAKVVDHLEETERSSDGFGSTGK